MAETCRPWPIVLVFMRSPVLRCVPSSRIDPHGGAAGLAAVDVGDRGRGAAVLPCVLGVDGGVDVRAFGGVYVDPGDVQDRAAGLDSALVTGSGGAIPGCVGPVHRPQVQLVAHPDDPDRARSGPRTVAAHRPHLDLAGAAEQVE